MISRDRRSNNSARIVHISVDKDAFFYANHCTYKTLSKNHIITIKVGKETKLYLVVANNILSEVVSLRQILMPETGKNMLHGIENFRYHYASDNPFLYALTTRLGSHGNWIRRKFNNTLINFKTFKY